MKQMTKAQALTAFRETVLPTHDFYECDYEVTAADGGWDLTARQMYEYVPFSSEHLFAVCRVFDTMNVNDSRYSIGGCDTCDYGSSYELTLRVRDGKPFPTSA